MGLFVNELASINLAISNVKRFHELQIPLTIDIETMPGVRCERINQPLDSVKLIKTLKAFSTTTDYASRVINMMSKIEKELSSK